jgi:hypothetical protein
LELKQDGDDDMSWKIEITGDGVEISNLFEEGGALIQCRSDGTFDLFEIPQYGGDLRFSGNFDCLLTAIKQGETFT